MTLLMKSCRTREAELRSHVKDVAIAFVAEARGGFSDTTDHTWLIRLLGFEHALKPINWHGYEEMQAACKQPEDDATEELMFEVGRKLLTLFSNDHNLEEKSSEIVDLAISLREDRYNEISGLEVKNINLLNAQRHELAATGSP